MYDADEEVCKTHLIVNDKDVPSKEDATVFIHEFEQEESSVPVYSIVKTQNQQAVGYEKVQSNFDNDSSDGKDNSAPQRNKLQIQMYRHSVINAHKKKVRCICIHHNKELIYSCGEDKRIALSSLGETKDKLLHIQCANFMPKAMVIHQELNRLYVSMEECMIFMFDISESTPIVQHSIVFPHKVSRLSIDSTINQLQCLTTQSQVICFQLSTKNPKTSEPTIYLKNKNENKEDETLRSNAMKWTKRTRTHNMNTTFFEGSVKGCLWLRDVNLESELQIPADFQDKVKYMHYDGDKNILFVSSKDGRFKCWKLPNLWQNKLMDDLHLENN